jgi:hypothetical protein
MWAALGRACRHPDSSLQGLCGSLSARACAPACAGRCRASGRARVRRQTRERRRSSAQWPRARAAAPGWPAAPRSARLLRGHQPVGECGRLLRGVVRSVCIRQQRTLRTCYAGLLPAPACTAKPLSWLPGSPIHADRRTDRLQCLLRCARLRAIPRRFISPCQCSSTGSHVDVHVLLSV